eukprot:7327372-Prymnesium_polylepis.1
MGTFNATRKLRSRHFPDEQARRYLERWIESVEIVVTHRYKHDMTCIVRKRTAAAGTGTVGSLERER